MAPARPTRRKTRPRRAAPEAPRPGAAPLAAPAAPAAPAVPAADLPARQRHPAPPDEEERLPTQDEQMDANRRIFDWVGLPVICPEAACRRGRHCCGVRPGAPRSASPPCFWIYREEFRFLLTNPLGIDAISLAAETGELPDPPTSPGFAEWDALIGRALYRMAKGRKAGSLLEALYDRQTLARIARKRPPDEPRSWEHDSDAFARAMARGEWRPSGTAAPPDEEPDDEPPARARAAPERRAADDRTERRAEPRLSLLGSAADDPARARLPSADPERGRR